MSANSTAAVNQAFVNLMALVARLDEMIQEVLRSESEEKRMELS